MNLTTIIHHMLSVGGIAGVIGVIITGAICVRYVQFGAEPIPEVLSHALLAIIGFYFGAGATSGSQKKDGD